MDNVQDSVTDALKRIGGAWGWLLAFGLLGIAAGLCMFFFTGQALYVIAIAFGVWLVAAGIFRFVAAFAVPDENGWMRVLYALISALAVALGVYLIAHPTLSILTLTLTVGFFWLIAGTMEFFLGIAMSGVPHRGWIIAGGLLGIIAGWVIIFSPRISTLALALLLGVWLIAYGLTAVVSAFRLHSATSSARAVLQPRHG
ncbi:MAG: DUF308 domain-containing protein [Candidatus Dormibacteraeota bacterium]|nr:DUF308 domain-containing protein [Candidatus Dormibacteraeota bacterium]